MQTEFQTYRKFVSKREAYKFCDFLNQENIPYRLVKVDQVLDSNILGNPLEFPYWIDIPLSEFSKLNYLLIEQTSEQLSEDTIKLDPLNDLSNNELLDLVKHPENWSIESVVVARQILLKRKIDPDQFTQSITSSNHKHLTNKDVSINEFTFHGCLIILFTFLHIVIGSLYAITSYLYFLHARETLMNGNRVFLFSEKSRKRAHWLVLFYITGLAAWMYKAAILNLF